MLQADFTISKLISHNYSYLLLQSPIWKSIYICQNHLTLHTTPSVPLCSFPLTHKSLHVQYHITPCLPALPLLQIAFPAGPRRASAEEQSGLGEARRRSLGRPHALSREKNVATEVISYVLDVPFMCHLFINGAGLRISVRVSQSQSWWSHTPCLTSSNTPSSAQLPVQKILRALWQRTDYNL